MNINSFGVGVKNWRLNIFLFFFLILAATIVSRLFYLQVLNHKFYQAQALGQQSQFLEVEGNRGEVFLGESKEYLGSPLSPQKGLAINQDKWLIFASPKEIEDKDNFAAILSQALGQTKEALLLKLKKSDSYAVIKKDLSLSDIDSIKKLKLKGLYYENKPKRLYPQGKLASQLIGFLGGDNIGQYGLEGYYEDILKGKKGIKEEKSGLAAVDSTYQGDLEYLNGSDLFLTIDYNIQFQAELLLEQAFKDFRIESGQIIVLKPDSGRILALANFPSFNPNKYSQEKNLDIFQNSAVQKIFEPGSVFKPFTMAMALNEGKVEPDTTFVDKGSAKIGPDTVYNFDHRIYGEQNMSGILEKSINTGAVFLSELIDNQTFFDYVNKFGFSKKTGVDLQGEVSSKNENLEKGPDFGFATASFGQGIEMTPLQLASAFCLLANGGRVVKPYVVEKIVHNQDQVITKPQLSNPVISQKTASQVVTMLTNVVERGFGKGAKIPGYYLAGKTGTAQVPFKDKKGYYPNKTVQSFIGFGPALNPQFLILVKLDDPKVPQSALSAVPIFKKLAQYIINYWQIPPDY